MFRQNNVRNRSLKSTNRYGIHVCFYNKGSDEDRGGGEGYASTDTEVNCARLIKNPGKTVRNSFLQTPSTMWLTPAHKDNLQEQRDTDERRDGAQPQWCLRRGKGERKLAAVGQFAEPIPRLNLISLVMPPKFETHSPNFSGCKGESEGSSSSASGPST